MDSASSGSGLPNVSGGFKGNGSESFNVYKHLNEGSQFINKFYSYNVKIVGGEGVIDTREIPITNKNEPSGKQVLRCVSTLFNIGAAFSKHQAIDLGSARDKDDQRDGVEESAPVDDGWILLDNSVSDFTSPDVRGRKAFLAASMLTDKNFNPGSNSALQFVAWGDIPSRFGRVYMARGAPRIKLNHHRS